MTNDTTAPQGATHPPLPMAHAMHASDGVTACWSADHMRAYADVAVAAAKSTQGAATASDAEIIALACELGIRTRTGAGAIKLTRAALARWGTPQPAAQAQAALVIAEAALADIGDADREPGDDVAWCEKRAAKDLPTIRAALKSMQGKHAAPQPAAQALDALKQVCAIAVSAAKTSSRDIADWREDMDRIAAIAAKQGGQ